MDWVRLACMAAGALLLALWVSGAVALFGAAVADGAEVQMGRAVTIPVVAAGLLLLLVPLLPAKAKAA